MGGKRSLSAAWVMVIIVVACVHPASTTKDNLCDNSFGKYRCSQTCDGFYYCNGGKENKGKTITCTEWAEAFRAVNGRYPQQATSANEFVCNSENPRMSHHALVQAHLACAGILRRASASMEKLTALAMGTVENGQARNIPLVAFARQTRTREGIHNGQRRGNATGEKTRALGHHVRHNMIPSHWSKVGL